MSKKNTIIEREEPDFDFSEFTDSSYENETVDMVSGLIDASNHQMKIALELTRLIVEKASSAHTGQEEILNAYKEAKKVVAETSPLKGVWEQLG